MTLPDLWRRGPPRARARARNPPRPAVWPTPCTRRSLPCTFFRPSCPTYLRTIPPNSPNGSRPAMWNATRPCRAPSRRRQRPQRNENRRTAGWPKNPVWTDREERARLACGWQSARSLGFAPEAWVESFSLENGFRRDAENGNRDGRAPFLDGFCFGRLGQLAFEFFVARRTRRRRSP